MKLYSQSKKPKRKIKALPFFFYYLNMNTKEQLAALAASKVELGDIVFLDGGQTMLGIAKLLVSKKITIITNNTLIKELNSQNIILLSGEFIAAQNINVSEMTFEELKDYQISKAFFGFSQSDAKGFYTSNEVEVALKQKVIAQAKSSFAVGEANKKGLGLNYLYAVIDELELITI